jgi:predicted kinase
VLRAYEAVRASAEQNLKLGASVVVDAGNDSDAARQTWRNAAIATGAPLLFVLLRPPPPADHQARLRARSRALRLVREPTWEDVVERAQTYEEWTDDLLELSATEPVDALVERLQQVLNLDR